MLPFTFAARPSSNRCGGNDVAVNGSMDHGHGDFDIRVNFSVCTHDERTTRRTNAAGQVTINSHHGLEVSFAGDYRAAAHETT